MLSRYASRKQIEKHKAYIRNRYRRHIRFSREFQTIEEVEDCFMKNLEDKYPESIVKDTFKHSSFIFGKAPNHEAEIKIFYRHPSEKYKDAFLMSMRYKINSANSTRAFVGGRVSFYIPDNEFRK